MKIPNLFLVGQPKSGTTASHDLLNQHPEVFMSPVKEPFFFCKDLIREKASFHNREIARASRKESEYLSFFAGVEDEKVIGESTTHYLYSKVAAKEIYKFNPDSQIIILLRNPVDFIYSMYSQYNNTSVDTAKNLSEALSLEQDRKAGKNIPPTVYFPSMLFYSERIKYRDQVARYFEVFDSSQIKVIIYEDFKLDNHGIYKEILDFLNVDTTFIPNFRRVNLSQKPRSKNLANMIFRSRIKKMIDHSVPIRLRLKIQAIGRKIVFKQQPRKPLDAKIRKKLMTEYKPEVIKISDFLGVDLVKKWGYDNIPLTE